jgi:hypothetical protein
MSTWVLTPGAPTSRSPCLGGALCRRASRWLSSRRGRVSEQPAPVAAPWLGWDGWVSVPERRERSTD